MGQENGLSQEQLRALEKATELIDENPGGFAEAVFDLEEVGRKAREGGPSIPKEENK